MKKIDPHQIIPNLLKLINLTQKMYMTNQISPTNEHITSKTQHQTNAFPSHNT